MQQNLREFYKKLLETINIYEHVPFEPLTIGDSETQLKVKTSIANQEKKPHKVLLPWDEVLDREEDFQTVIFHPMSESIFRGQSPVMNKILTHSAMMLAKVFLNQISAIHELALDRDHSKLTPGAFDIISTLEIPKSKVGKEGAKKLLAQVLGKMTGVSKAYPICSFKLKRVSDKEVLLGNVPQDSLRVCYLNTPLARKDNLFGVKAPRADSAKFVRKIFETVFNKPFGDIVYEAGGSSSKECPYFFSWLDAYSKAVEKVNELTKVLNQYDFDIPVLKYVYEEEATLSLWKKTELPMSFDGNSGAGALDKEAAESNREVETIEISRPQPVVDNSQPIEQPPIEQPPLIKPAQPLVKPAQQQPHFQETNHMQNHNNVNPYLETPSSLVGLATKKHQPGPATGRVMAGQGGQPQQYDQPQGRIMAQQPVMQAEAQQAAPQTSRRAVAQSQVQAQANKPKIKSIDEQEVHVQDYYGNYLYDFDGNPYILKNKDIPKKPFVVEEDNYGNQVFDPATRLPNLMEIRVQNQNQTQNNNNGSRWGGNQNNWQGNNRNFNSNNQNQFNGGFQNNNNGSVMSTTQRLQMMRNNNGNGNNNGSRWGGNQNNGNRWGNNNNGFR